MPRRNKITPHQRFNFANNCQTKRRFSSENAALATAGYQMLIVPGLELTIYKCELCGGWHLTRQLVPRN